METTLWFPHDGPPDGPSDAPRFRVTDNYGYRSEGHPAGESSTACFVVLDGFAYPTLGIAETTIPTFQIIGSFAYAPVGAPWFRIKKDRRLRIAV